MGERDRNQPNYDRNQGGYEHHDESSYQQSQRGARDWEPRDESRRAQAQGHDQSGLGREYNERNQQQARPYQERSSSYEAQRYGSHEDRERHERDQERARRYEAESSYQRSLQGGQYGEHRSAYDFERRPPAPANRGYANPYGEHAHDNTVQGYPQRDFGQHDYPSRSFAERNYAQRHFGEHSSLGQRDWNDRNSAQRDWGQRAYGEVGDYRSGQGRENDESWGQQLRDAGHQVAQKVKRIFRGPKGYKRSDERIREDVSDRLAQQDRLDPSDVEVTVTNGEVTLTGTVQTRNEKFLAEEIADDVSGVNDVHNQLRLRRDQTTQASTADATTNVSNQNATESTRNRNARA